MRSVWPLLMQPCSSCAAGNPRIMYGHLPPIFFFSRSRVEQARRSSGGLSNHAIRPPPRWPLPDWIIVWSQIPRGIFFVFGSSTDSPRTKPCSLARSSCMITPRRPPSLFVVNLFLWPPYRADCGRPDQS
ncbi:hypothetical protein BJX68DRAFT_244513 [Aspergillus pseudodeflectus]|uniref:Secreted protein n=1 Tax=Aspergillus pseudodeflectus TaxID=176178 RepID=A0ABR4JTD7_9EURO